MSIQVTDNSQLLHTRSVYGVNYHVQDIEDADENTRYTGYQSEEQSWMLVKEVFTGSGSSSTTRFTFGKLNYSGNWDDRTNKTYRYIADALSAGNIVKS